MGAPPEELASAADFIAAYEAAGFAEPYAAYGPMSYDAANAIIEALKVALPTATDAKSAREAIVAATNDVAFDGASGRVEFDDYGDTITRTITVYKVANGAWGTEKVVSLD